MVTAKKIIASCAVVILVIGTVFLFSPTFKKSEEAGYDFSNLYWTDAYKKLHETLSNEYAFTQWKGVDWAKLYSKYLPQIEAAQQKNDFEAYYITLLAYLNEIPDGHVRVNHIDKLDDKYIGGGFGFSIAKLDDGKIIVAWVDETSPAWASGIRVGTEIVEWNGRPIHDATADVSTIFAGTSATTEYLQCKQLQYLVRAPVGTQVSILLKDDMDATAKLISLTAYDDNKLSLKKNYPNSVVSDKVRNMYLGLDDPDPVPEAIVEDKILEGNICYIKLWAELDADLKQTGKMESTLDLFRFGNRKGDRTKMLRINS